MLSNSAVKNAKAGTKPYKLTDERGLSLHVQPTGAKWWRLKYRVAGREKLMSLGTYPDTSLALAREKRDKARQQLAVGDDPSALRKAEKAAQNDTFKAIAEEWSAQQPKAESTRIRDGRILGYLYEEIGAAPIGTIDTAKMLEALREIEKRGAETAHRAQNLASAVFLYAIPHKAKTNPAANLRGKLVAASTKSHAAITNAAKFGQLLRDIDNYQGQPVTRAALQLIALVFTRPGELRQALWQEFDLEGAQWVVPAERMKMRREHIVPLVPQSVSILTDLREVTYKGAESLVFPSLRPLRPLSENTLGTALKSLGYDGNTHVAHGFRSSASTLLHEMGVDSDVIECQLAHARPGVGGIYNRSHRLADRRKMMQKWANYLGKLKMKLDSHALSPAANVGSPSPGPT
jgi:integrase